MGVRGGDGGCGCDCRFRFVVVFRPGTVVEAVTSFYLDAPSGSAFNYTYTASAISPDGRHLVFRVATASQAPALWLRPLNSLEGRRLVGTDGADFPFWSPDSQSIGFFSSGKLKRVDINGSSPIAISDAADADTWTTGGSWSRKGVIVFGALQGMYRVNAAGGTPQLFATMNGNAGETGYGFPQFLPDDDRFLLHVRSENPKQAGLYVSSLSRPDQKTRLLETPRKGIVVPNEDGAAGYPLYLQERTLLARRMDRRDPRADAATPSGSRRTWRCFRQASTRASGRRHPATCSCTEQRRQTGHVLPGSTRTENDRATPTSTIFIRTCVSRRTGHVPRWSLPTARATWMCGPGMPASASKDSPDIRS